MTAIEVAKAALCEGGLPDLAELVRANRQGMPTVSHACDVRDVVAKAFLLAHQAVGHDDWLEPAPDSQGRWSLAINCELVSR